MENLRDKMLKAIDSAWDKQTRTYNENEAAAECARVAEEEIAKAFDEGWSRGNYGSDMDGKSYLKSLK